MDRQPNVGATSATATTTTAEAAACAHSTAAAPMPCVRATTATHTRAASAAAPMCYMLAATTPRAQRQPRRRDALRFCPSAAPAQRD